MLFGKGLRSFRLFMGDFSLDAVGKVFGDGWLERGARCTTGVPLSVECSLHGAALRVLSLARWQASEWSVGKLLC
jgi:hypothetical protein